MQDLRHKVMNLLEDPTLDAVKLTQHVCVLRLMESPRRVCVQRFLHVHKLRAERSIASFIQSQPSTSPSSSSSSSSSFSNLINGASIPITTGGLQSVSDARQFHQVLISGLIEATKGLTELFCPPSANNTVTMTPNSPKNSAQKGNGCESSSNATAISNSYSDPIALRADASAAHQQLTNCLSSLLSPYVSALTAVIKDFLDKYSHALGVFHSLEHEGRETQQIQLMQVKYFEVILLCHQFQFLSHSFFYHI